MTDYDYCDILHQELPLSLINDVACFVFYDHHPKGDKYISITICTTTGIVKEFYERDLLSSVTLDCSVKPTDILLLRNGKCELFYLVSAGDALFILSRKETLQVHKKVTNVDKYYVDDAACSGHASLRIIFKDDAVPLEFDENFVALGERALIRKEIHGDHVIPLITGLKTKLTESKYIVKCNEKKLKEVLKLRQAAAFSVYQKIHPNQNDSEFKDIVTKISKTLKIKTQTPWVKVCNKKVVVVLNLSNQDNIPIDDVHILLHSTSKPSMVYTTKLFKKQLMPPFWFEQDNQLVENGEDAAVVVVIDLEELKYHKTSKIEFNGVIAYKKEKQDFLFPFDNVIISSLNTMGEDFDVLSGNSINENSILAILATTEKLELIFRHIKKESEHYLNMAEMFCTYLQMQNIGNIENIIIHRKSPYHVLNGLMIVFEDLKNIRTKAYMYARSADQVPAFLHYIQDAIPHKIIVTTANYLITAKTDEYSAYNELQV